MRKFITFAQKQSFEFRYFKQMLNIYEQFVNKNLLFIQKRKKHSKKTIYKINRKSRKNREK